MYPGYAYKTTTYECNLAGETQMELEGAKKEMGQKKEKKPYATPQLVQHGAIEEITGQRTDDPGCSDLDFDGDN
jgi:hypothetical protein